MKTKNIGKIALSLCIALAFLMPVSAIANGVEVTGSRQAFGNNSNAVLKQFDTPLIGEAEVYVVELQNFTDPMAVGCYEFDVLLEKCEFLHEPQECDVKIFLDIWKEEEVPGEEIICTDFEDVGEIYNNWEACDGVSGDGSSPDCAIDTWSWSDARSHSPGHSMHSSMFDTYLGNQNDYLILYQTLDKDYTRLKLDFWHWCEGEIIDLNDGSGGTALEDWGIVQYSYDGINWIDLSERFYDNDWIEEAFTINDCEGESEIWIRFYWHTGPTIQNEGWYVDDVCLYGYEDAGWGMRVFDTYTPHAITIPAGLGFFSYLFDEGYCFEEGNYSIRIWVLTETENCVSLHPQNDPFWFNFTVKDIMDIAVTANDFVITNAECNGGDLLVTGEVCNVGTLDAEDVQVTLTILEQIIETPFYSLVEESDFSDWSISYIDYSPDDIDWFVTEVDSYSPTHSWTCVNETTHHARQQACGVFTPELNPFDGDPIDLDITMKIKYNLLANMEILPAFIGTAYYWGLHNAIGGDPGTRYAPIQGPASTGWTEFSYNQLLVDEDNYWEQRYWGPQTSMMDLIHLMNERYGPEGLDVEDFTALTFGLYFTANVGGFGPGWSGLYIDDYKIIKILPGAERHSETIIIPELAVGECVDVEFTWENMPTGNFIETKCVPPDDNNDNNCMSGAFEIWSDIDCADEVDIETYDLTTAEANHWHVTSSGYDNYMWCGEEATGTYGSDWNDPLCVTNAGDASIDMSGASTFTFDFMDYFEGDGGNDYGIIEINPAVSSPASQWYTYDPTPVTLLQDDFEGAFPAAGWYTGPVTGFAPWMQVPYGWTWTGHDAFLGGSPTQYAIADSDWNGPGTDCELITPAIDMSPAGSYSISYNTLWYITGGEICQIEAYSGLGFTFEEVLFDYGAIPGAWVASPTIFIDPSGYTDPSMVYLRFYYNDLGVWQWYWMLDDVFVQQILDPPLVTTGDHGWEHQVMTFDTSVHLDHFKNPYTGDTFANEIGAVTDDMGVRLRFISDDEVNYRGWLLNDFSLLVDGGYIVENDPCDDHTNLIPCGMLSGDWWTFDGIDTWTCQDLVSGIIPNDVDCALVWDTSVPQAMAAEIHFEHNHELDADDYCYLEFSTNGGDSWTAPIRFTGSSVGWTSVDIDMTPFTGDNVLIRWRVETNESNPSTYYKVKEMCIVAQVDTVAPITVGTISGTIIYGWYSSPVTFTATASDDVSGVAATYYKIDGGSQLMYSAPITISVNGEHYIEFWSVDNVGNEEVHQFTPTFKIDTGSAPSVAITAPGDGLYLFGNQLLSLSGKTIIIGGFTVEATASDSDSGVYRVQFALDGTQFGEATSSPYSAYCGEKHTGAGTIQVTAEDFTGNTASATKDITYFKFL